MKLITLMHVTVITEIIIITFLVSRYNDLFLPTLSQWRYESLVTPSFR